MISNKVEKLRNINTFPSLVNYLRDELDWPIESDDFEELTYEYEADELGIDAKTSAKIKEIKQLRPLSSNQPWGIFFVNFEPKQLPIVVLRRILRSLVFKKRDTANKPQQAAWRLHDLLFISSQGEAGHREISFAHFSEPADRLFGDLPTLRVLGWDDDDTKLKLDYVVKKLSEKLRWPEKEKDTEAWRSKWSDAFELRPRQVITTSKDLAVRLADLAKSIRQKANLILNVESERGPLRKLHKAFQTALIHDLKEDDFADMYAQTIAYGLLAARVSRPSGVIADNLADMVPITNPFLKEMLGTFLTVGGRKGKIDFDELGIQEIVDLLNSPQTHMEAVLRDFGKRTMQEDPVVHFYELFLKEYDKKKKVERGVFYTPQPVVSYIVRSVHDLLKTEFGLEDGLASIISWGEMVTKNPDIKIPEGLSPDEPFVQILDPATGTATFLVEAIEVIHAAMEERWKKEGHMAMEMPKLWNEYVPKHLLPRLYGFELMMAPYAIAHMKIGLKLAETDYRFGSDERAHIYLTNSLEPPSDLAEQPQFEKMAPALAHEARAVNAVKSYKTFTVVIGNPPYAKMSSNLGEYAISLIEPFRYVDGELIREKGALAHEINLQDDYVKFYGLMLKILSKASMGIGSYISNFRFLDSPSLRGMRRSLMKDRRYLGFLDLGGHLSDKRAHDENVFDIEQGVAIGVVITRQGAQCGTVAFGNLLGSTEDKYRLLSTAGAGKMMQNVVMPAAPFYRFRPSEGTSAAEFFAWPDLSEIFPKNSGCVITSRDNLTIDFDISALLEKIKLFAESSRGDTKIMETIGFSVKAKWDVESCKKSLRAHGISIKEVRPILYRLFDIRKIYYFLSLLDTPSRPICDLLMRGNNIVLLSPRVKTTADFSHCFVSRVAAEKKVCSHDRASQMFPLWGASMGSEQIPNVNGAFLTAMEFDKSPESVLGYIYAVLHSMSYRKKYGELLRDTFARIPTSRNKGLVSRLVNLGDELVSLHLLESPSIDKLITCFTESGEAEVEKISYSESTVWIDKERTRGFQGVPERVWNFQIGGYQVCEKWLKDRKGRTLSSDDINHYQRIVVALNETIRIMAEIDNVIEAYGGWPGAFQDKSDQKYGSKPEPAQNVKETGLPYEPSPVKVSIDPHTEPVAETTLIATRSAFVKNDWQSWLALSNWAKQTTRINTYWADFALEISNVLKGGKQPTDKQKENMKKCWSQAVKQGFKF